MIKFKVGIHTSKITPEVARIMNVANRVYGGLKADAIVTALEDGKHKEGSLHYKCLAADLRIRHVAKGKHENIRSEMARLLGGDYDIVLHSSHLHVEYDPD